MGGASNRILQVAEELFAHNGYRGTSVDDIAAAADISRSSLFWHFGSKEGLLRAVIETNLASWVRTISGAGDGRRGLRALRAAVSTLSTLHADHPSMGRLLSILMNEASATETSLVPTFTEFDKVMTGLWQKWLFEAIEDREFRPGVDARKAADILNAAIVGTRQLRALQPENHEPLDMEQGLLHVIDGLSWSGPSRRATARSVSPALS